MPPESKSTFEVKFNNEYNFKLFNERWGTCKSNIAGLYNREAILKPGTSINTYRAELSMMVDCTTAFVNFQAAIRKTMGNQQGLTAEALGAGDCFTLNQLTCSL